MKKLSIRFVRFERAFAMQILEQKGEFKNTEHVFLEDAPFLLAGAVFLRGFDRSFDLRVCGTHIFASNKARDQTLEQIIYWISKEQFATKGKLEIGKNCEVSDNGKDWVERKLIAVLPENYINRYIAEVCDNKNRLTDWECARPIDFIQPKIEGDVYTWEMEVAQ